MNPYQKLLLVDTPRACERNKEHSRLNPFRERHLHAIWAEQKWFTPLTTASGKAIEVISPGIWNSGAGPDFLKAELKIGGIVIRGDVEIHIRESDWVQHGHSNDSRYNDVVLHVSLYEGTLSQQMLKQDGTSPELTYLEKKLTHSLDELTRQIDLDQYPYKEFLGSGTCAHTLFHELDDQKIDLFFHQAALWRAAQKYEQLNSYVDDSAELLIAGVCQALGFKRNSASFLQLYRYVYPLNIKDESEMLALLMRLTGFFHEKFEKQWGANLYYQKLMKLAPQVDLRIPLSFLQIRPLNHPLRRLVYLSKFLTDDRRYTLQTDLMNLWDANANVGEGELKSDLNTFVKKLKALIPSYTDPHFEKSFFFEAAHSSKKLGLIGAETKNEILLNVFIPFLQNIMNRPSDQIVLSALLKSFPVRASGKFTYLTHRFFGQTDKKNCLERGDLQQGSYQLHKDFCQHYESSCQGCPFVKRYQNIFNT